ncbi:TPA: hypothetical protein R4217_003728 [Enterobacter soli]|nr:hypothetical protein [Enterobacter soli]
MFLMLLPLRRLIRRMAFTGGLVKKMNILEALFSEKEHDPFWQGSSGRKRSHNGFRPKPQGIYTSEEITV